MNFEPTLQGLGRTARLLAAFIEISPCASFARHGRRTQLNLRRLAIQSMASETRAARTILSVMDTSRPPARGASVQSIHGIQGVAKKCQWLVAPFATLGYG